MKAYEIYEILKGVAPAWFNPDKTVDRFLFGDPEVNVNKVAVAWMPTFPNLEKAAKLGCNLFITHEPLYAAGKNQFDIWVGGAVRDYKSIGKEGIPLERDDIWVKKTEWLEKHGITVLRIHDIWDDFPEIGIHGAWASFLGFNNPVENVKYYEIHETGGVTFGEILDRIYRRVKILGQHVIHYIGDPSKKTSRIAFGTGAITNYRYMYSLGADVLVLTDDGTRLWESGQWAEDSGTCIIILNHATAEEPGVRKLAEYLNEKLPDIEVIPITRGCIYNIYPETINNR